MCRYIAIGTDDGSVRVLRYSEARTVRVGKCLLVTGGVTVITRRGSLWRDDVHHVRAGQSQPGGRHSVRSRHHLELRQGVGLGLAVLLLSFKDRKYYYNNVTSCVF